ncbi:inverse autotransporter beta domain-containing protein [Enterobacter sp. SLBN-59]|uniref:inverse autotransporter beta domain-containing protein n=1 Tax=Enterobacter sp. SLBN-59 TaxID=2940621 RepID=UPI002168A155|nr:inverse autotransporter beta domain-containing protein [Enterobacter sp. SLBN-59]MCS3491020.1 adhesin/invasin [Enterobacter sp. SLBN-59]
MKTHLLHLTARVCLAAQLTGILTGTLVPVVSLAKGTVPAHTLTDSRTLPHTLGEGETVTAVAAQYGLTVAALKKLNQLRTFSKPFEQLSAGDEIDVPAIKAGPGREPAAAAQDDPAAFWAGTATTTGQMLQSGDTTRAATGMAGSLAAGAASAEVQRWLSRAGTARVSLSVDNEFAFSDASVDYLLPFYDSPDWLAFTQLGYRHKDERHTVNLGAGLRTFRNGWMYGMNAFLDNDLTGRNRRLGMGAEAWTDYLRLSANGYRGITGWHQSRDFADYDERPASGFDVRMEGWVPAYPQLGGKLVYEQYLGNEVALFGRDERQKDPKAVTAGVNYTPVPLVTLGAEHRQGQGGHSDARFSVGLNYRPGVPWADQTDPAAVGLSRTLAAGRYDLVERNNSIVLEYKKQTLIRLSLPETLAGRAGNTDTLTATVTSRYGVSGIDWEYGEVLAAGGRVSEVNKTSLQITHPPYQAVARGAESNVYRISAVARDGQGNVSERRTTTITVQEPEAAIARGDLTVTRNNAVANGTDTNAVQATVTDANGNPVSGQAVSFTATNGAVVTVTSASTGEDGVATATLTNTKAGAAAVTASVGSSSQTVDTTFVADGGTAAIASGDLKVTRNNAVANGTDTNAVQATVTDANGNPVSGQAVSFTATNGAVVTVTSASTGEDGVATATLTNTKAGAAAVTASVGSSSQTVDTTFVADGGTAAIASGDLKVTRNNAVANGTDTNAVQATVTDANGNPVSGQAVSFTATNGAVVTVTSASTGEDGVATATLTNTKAGAAAVTASVGSSSQTVDTTFVADGGTAAIASGDLKVTRNNAVANGTDTNAVQATVTDANGNPVSGQAVSFTATNGAVVTVTSASTGEDGVATATLTNTKAGAAAVTASVGSSSQTVDTTFVAGAPDDTHSSLTANPTSIVANNTATTTITWGPKDANGNPVTGLTGVSFDLGGATDVTLGSVTESPAGSYTATLKGSTAQAVTVKPAVAGTVTGGLSATVTLTAAIQPMPSTTKLAVNGATFAVDSGFPTTGFMGATYQIRMNGDAGNNNGYDWSADQSWVSVDAGGNVKFTGTGSRNTVTITAKPKAGGASLTYRFTLNGWFTPGTSGMNLSSAKSYCSTRGSLPAVEQMTLHSGYVATQKRNIGALWNEWGDMSTYGAGFSGSDCWSSEQQSSGSHYNVYLISGNVNVNDSFTHDVVCRQGL